MGTLHVGKSIQLVSQNVKENPTKDVTLKCWKQETHGGNKHRTSHFVHTRGICNF